MIQYSIFDKTNVNISHIYNFYKSINDNELLQIKKNCNYVMDIMQAKAILVMNQQHTNNVLVLDKKDISCNEINDFFDPLFTSNDIKKNNYLKLNQHKKLAIATDACVTNIEGLLLTVRTADCVPILLYEEKTHIVAAIHSGWRSLKNNIIENTLKEMYKFIKSDDNSNIKAIIGPAISKDSYEVGKEFYDDFIYNNVDSNYIDYEKYFEISNIENKYKFDIVNCVKDKLIGNNIEIIKHINEDTYSTIKKYPSYRRSMHNNEQYRENILSTIMIN